MNIAINFLCMNKISNFYFLCLVFISKNTKTYDTMNDQFRD